MTEIVDYCATMESIDKCSMLVASDAEFIGGAIKEIQDNWNKRQVFRTETEMRISVLNDIKFPTPAAKYWQCVREQAVFYENLVTLSFEYRRNMLEQEKLKQKIEKEYDQLEKELLQVDLEEKQFAQLNMEQIAKDRVREIRLWQKIMAEEAAKADFDKDDANTHQLVSYAHRFDRQMQNIGNASPSEKANLVGQFNTALRHLEEAGLLSDEGGKLKILDKPRSALHAIR